MHDGSTDAPARTPLYELHRELGGRMVAFAGYEMPLQYTGGILKEHAHTRTQAGLFDVSHMGQIRVVGADAAAALESLMPIDVLGLAPGRQRYGFLTNQSGGVLDDLMVVNEGDSFLLVVNAAGKARVHGYLAERLAGRCRVELLAERTLLALQGPAAAGVMARIAPGADALGFMHAAGLTVAGVDCGVSRSGYTGEDGFEISVASADAELLARALLAEPGVAPIGLGARDSLRLEAGLCLYGQDLNPDTTPVEAALEWALARARRAEGARPGGYPGAERILHQLAHGVERRRVGLKPESRVPVRAGCELLNGDGGHVGRVTSGGFGPTIGAPIAMGYVATKQARVGARLAAMVRGQPVAARVTELPFVPHRYVRATKG